MCGGRGGRAATSVCTRAGGMCRGGGGALAAGRSAVRTDPQQVNQALYLMAGPLMEGVRSKALLMWRLNSVLHYPALQVLSMHPLTAQAPGGEELSPGASRAGLWSAHPPSDGRQ